MGPHFRWPATDAAIIQWPKAVRPAPGNSGRRVEGYRPERYYNPQTGLVIPALVASARRSRLFELFLNLLEPLGPSVDVVLESSHAVGTGLVATIRRHGIDRSVFASHLCEFDELLLDDGCTGMIVVAAQQPLEVHFDDHKHLIVYAHDRRAFVATMRRHGLRRRDDMPFVFESAHVHHTEPHHAERFRELADRLCESGHHSTEW